MERSESRDPAYRNVRELADGEPDTGPEEDYVESAGPEAVAVPGGELFASPGVPAAMADHDPSAEGADPVPSPADEAPTGATDPPD